VFWFKENRAQGF